MMIKSGHEFILKFTKPLQRYLLSCQANSAILGSYFCTGQQQLGKGLVNFKIKSLNHFYHPFQVKSSNFKTRDFSPLIKGVLAGVARLSQPTWLLETWEYCTTIKSTSFTASNWAFVSMKWELSVFWRPVFVMDLFSATGSIYLYM